MSVRQNNSKDMTVGPIWKNLYDLSAPMVVGIFAVMSISLVDTYFVGKLGTNPLAALSFTFPVVLTIMSLAIGVSAGAASIVSRAIGAKDIQRSRHLSTDSVLLSFLLVLVLTVIGYFTIKPLFFLMGARGEVLDMIVRYMEIWYISMPFLVIPMVINALIRAAGDSFWPSVTMIATAVINVTLTPAMINGWWFFPAMHIEGAAISTLIAYICGFIFAGIIIFVRANMLTLQKRSLAKTFASWKEISKIALPAAAGNALYPITTGIITAILATYGEEVVAAYGASTRIESFACIPMFALSAAIGPVAGQNWGADKNERVYEAQKKSYIACFIWSSFTFFVFLFLSGWVAEQFSSDALVQPYIKNYLLIISVTFWGYGFCIVAAGCFNAIGRPYTALVYYSLRCFVMCVPFCFVISLIFRDVEYIFYAIALANVLSGALIAYHALKQCKACP